MQELNEFIAINIALYIICDTIKGKSKARRNNWYTLVIIPFNIFKRL